MKRLIIICEGPTEQEFCKDVLYPHFLEKGILIESPTIKKTAGGICSWPALKSQIENHLSSDTTAFVTTLIDFYGLYEKMEYPGWTDRAQNNSEKVGNIETGMKNDIDGKYNYRFIPNIQLHEFECLVFCSLEVLQQNFKPNEADFPAIESVINSFSNPEEINNGSLTAPSKRLIKHIRGYDKIVYGSCLISEIGLPLLREKCPRFNNWITRLESI